MRAFPELRPRLLDSLVAAAVLALAAVCAACTWGGGTGQLTAVVEIDGVEADRFFLDHSGAHTYPAGDYTLTVEETEEGVRVSHSDCPTQDCVRTGTISRSGQSIVCLPARLSVTLTGGGAEVDAVIG